MLQVQLIYSSFPLRLLVICKRLFALLYIKTPKREGSLAELIDAERSSVDSLKSALEVGDYFLLHTKYNILYLESIIRLNDI